MSRGDAEQRNFVNCKVCNIHFLYSKQHKVYCSAGCCRIGQKRIQHNWYRNRKPFLPRTCRICGISIPETSPRFTLCSELCADQAEQIRLKKRAIEQKEKIRIQKHIWWLNNIDKHRESNRRSQQKRLSKPGTAKREMARYRANKAKVARYSFTLRDETRMLNRQRNSCVYCSASIPPGHRHLDHVVPLSKGGRHGPSNLVFACVRCNSSKNDKYVMVWRLAMSKRSTAIINIGS